MADEPDYTEEEIAAANERTKEEFDRFFRSLLTGRTKGVLRLALNDAANNCLREDATAVLTLRSGVQMEGKLKKPELHDDTVHLRTTVSDSDGDQYGWITVDMDEVTAVEARPKRRERPRL